MALSCWSAKRSHSSATSRRAFRSPSESVLASLRQSLASWRYCSTLLVTTAARIKVTRTPPCLTRPRLREPSSHRDRNAEGFVSGNTGARRRFLVTLIIATRRRRAAHQIKTPASSSETPGGALAGNRSRGDRVTKPSPSYCLEGGWLSARSPTLEWHYSRRQLLANAAIAASRLSA